MDFALNYANVVQSWYPLVTSDSLKPGKSIPVNCFDLRLVLFRTQQGALGLVGRNCTHMGGDLANGCVTAKGIQCPIHQWEFAPNGDVVGDNQLGLSNERRPCQTSFVCDEAHGIIHAYFGSAPAFELPKFSEPVFLSKVETKTVDLRYDVPSIFGFDSEHFKTVHKRGIDTLTVYKNHDAHLGTYILAGVEGTRIGDRIMRKLGMNTVELDIDFWAANIIFGKHKHSNTSVFLSAMPISENTTRMFVSIAQLRPKGGLLQQTLGRLRFAIAKPVTRAFFKQDETALNGVRFDRDSPYLAGNSTVHEWLEHYDSLPRFSAWREEYR